MKEVLQQYINNNKDKFVDLSEMIYYSNIIKANIDKEKANEKKKLDSARRSYYEKHSLI